MGLFGRKKSEPVVPILTTAPTPGGPSGFTPLGGSGHAPQRRDIPAAAADAGAGLLDGALDALAAVLRALGHHAFDIASTDRESFARRCEVWALHVLTGAPLAAREVAEPLAPPVPPRPAPRGGRSFKELGQFILEHRREEQRFVESRIGELKEAIWQFVQGLRTIAGGDREIESRIQTSLTQIERAVEKDSLETIRALVPLAVRGINRALDDRRTRFEEQTAALGARLRALRSDLLEARRKMELDPLTQLYNRGAFDSALQSYVDLCLFAGQPLTLLMIDLDHFKAVNDEHGHPAGDRVLVAASRCIQRSFPRKNDLVARYGGEEFAVLLPDATLADTARLTERLLDTMRAVRVALADGQPPVEVSCSVGYAELRVDDTPEVLVQRADAALYRAKDEGRDRSRAG